MSKKIKNLFINLLFSLFTLILVGCGSANLAMLNREKAGKPKAAIAAQGLRSEPKKVRFSEKTAGISPKKTLLSALAAVALLSQVAPVYGAQEACLGQLNGQGIELPPTVFKLVISKNETFGLQQFQDWADGLTSEARKFSITGGDSCI